MGNIVILGAGLTGISTAYHLEQRNFFDYTIFEKESTIGGLCRSITSEGFTFDYTGHLLHVSDPYFRQLIDSIIGIDNFNTIFRKSFIHSHNTYTRYPFQVNLFGLPPEVIAECIEGFVTKSKRSNPRTLYTWVLQNFGKGIARHFFFPFQEKILAYNLKKITPTWMGRFVPSTSLPQMIQGAVRDNEENFIGYNAQFFYPKQGGIQSWVYSLACQIQKPIFTQYTLKKIDLKNKRLLFANGYEETYKQLISTIPLDKLLAYIDDKSTTHFNQAASKLVCNSVINFNLGISKPNLTHKHWIHFPENKFPFYRLGFPHNFATSMAPEGCSSVYGEIAYVKKSKPFDTREITNTAISKVCNLFSLKKSDIITEKIIEIDHAYVIYNFWREKNLEALLKALEQEGIYSIGRYGGWKYSSMQEAILDGKKIAELLTIIPAQQKKKDTVKKSTNEKEIGLR